MRHSRRRSLLFIGEASQYNRDLSVRDSRVINYSDKFIECEEYNRAIFRTDTTSLIALRFDAICSCLLEQIESPD